MFAAPVTRRIIDCGWRRRSPERPVIAYVSPYASSRAFVPGLNGNGGVITVKTLGRKDMHLDQIEDRHESRCRVPDLVGQRRGRKIDPFAFEPGTLPVERAVHAELVEQDRRQQMRTDEAARRGMERCRRLADRLTVTARELYPHRLD